MGIAVGVLGLAFLVFGHETGHFLAARAVGMRPRKFYLGFPPALVKVVRGGVEYGIGMIPLGGYVKLPGMHRPAPGDLRATIAPAEAQELNEPLTALDAALASGDDDAARKEIDLLAPQLPGNRLVEEIRDGLAPDAYWRQRAWKRVVVIAAGPAANVLLALVLFTVAFSGANVSVGRLTRGVYSVLPGYPAQKAGLKAGDQIEKIAGRPVVATGIQHGVESTRGRPFTIVVDRHGHLVTIGPLRARKQDGRYIVGFEINAADGPGEPLPRAVSSAVHQTGSIISETAQLIGQLIHGRGTRNVSSVVGIVKVSAAAYQASIWDFIDIVAAISLALGLANLLPLLPFDGGHIVMSLLEGARRRAFSQLVYLRYSAVGLTLFVVLMYLGLRNDTGF